MAGKQIENIEHAAYEKIFQIGENTCKILSEDAFYGEWQGKKELLDQNLVDNMYKEIIKVISRYSSKYNPIPTQICLQHTHAKELQKQEDSAKNLAEVRKAKYQLDDVALAKETREQIDITLVAVKNREKLMIDWGLGEQYSKTRAIILNFYGYAGTGKSMTAEAVANYLGKKLLLVNYSELESKYVGETPKNIRKVFETAEKEDAVLVFDEADSFLSKRLTNITQSADYGVNITRSVMLMELERFGGVVIFTTNLIQNYDTAFKRRILASIEFTLPDIEAREKIWKLHIGNKLPLEDNISVKLLAEQYDSISGADIKDIVFYAALNAVKKEKELVGREDLDKAYQYVMKRYEE